MDLERRGKRALVTGSNKGIGEAIARGLAGEGVAVLIHGRNAEQIERVAQEIVSTGSQATPVVGDLGTDAGTDAVTVAIGVTLGSIDILVKKGGARQWPDFERRFLAEFMPNADQRMDRPEEVADLVAFLASPCTDFLNGAHYAIDGGRVR